MREVNSLGTAILTWKIGSSSTGPHFGMPSRIASCAALRNAMSDESTVWYWPSVSVTAMSTTGKPSGPRVEILAHAGLDRRNVLLRHHAAGDPYRRRTKPAPRGNALISMCTSPNSPWPPDCFLCRACWLTEPRMVSL